jgi:hypothetical protein
MDKPETGIGRKSSKAQAILLAVLFGPWTWLYTYHQDKRKFWVSLILIPVAFILIAATISLALSTPDLFSTGTSALFLLIIFLVLHEVFSGAISFLIVLWSMITASGPGVDFYPIWTFYLLPACIFLPLAAVWVYAIIGSTTKPKVKYESEPEEISKKTALIMAIAFSYNAWLYTYRKDAWKFWVSFGAFNLIVPLACGLMYFLLPEPEPIEAGEYVSGTPFVLMFMGTIIFLSAAILLVIWLLAILDNRSGSNKWKNFETQVQREEVPS